MQRTMMLLDESEKTLPAIAEETGISFYWLRHFKSGEYKDPSVNRVQRVYEFLTGEPLLQE